ncbi:MAG: PSD1 and planctomycete cytochrome C domain-containing protein [Planctomycetaceae bacterium]|nr:PSD1 and planctomycete cytochrome C domain-containing protein [Planctomycetaceae bacterium]
MNRPLACLACLLFFVRPLAAAGDDPPDFSREVLPILSDKCFVCHGPDAAELGEDMRRLDSFAAAHEATETGRAIDAKAPHQSLILQRVFSADDPMPPEDADKQLSDAEKGILKRWIEGGGNYAKHWAFVPPVKTALPAGSDNPIDAFIKVRLQQRRLDFAPRADRPTLARRVALLLTGLPPEPEQLQQYLGDNSPGAYARLVEQLLDSPRFGEHQARYWLDAVRYGDTHGLHLDNRRGIYPYRDWVVRAFNRNLPLDDFITWQLAGDLLPDATVEQKLATGFVRLNPSTSEGGAIPAEFQAKNNFDRTETLGTVLLGVSMTCARCHTHKYDPITHADYYGLLAFFNSTAESPMDGNKYEYGPTLRVPSDQRAWEQWAALMQQGDDLVRSSVDALKSQQKPPVADNTAAMLRWLAADDSPFAGTATQQQALALGDQLEALTQQFTTTLVAQELPKPRVTRVLHRGEYTSPTGEALTPAVLPVMGSLPNAAPSNRLGLARWLTSREHPTVSRVLINRIWQRTLGYGLVRTPEDFGVQGQQPTHPELLDWLAVELQDSNWDLQHMLRLMVHSRTFQQSSAWRSDVDDPENRLYARATSYRMDAEMIRDMGLWASSLLDPTMGGEGVKPYQPSGMWLAMAHPASNTKKYERDSGQRLYRRSLYVYWKRTSPHPMMTLFDAPDRESSCVRRSRTNTSLQSLGLLNETQRIEMSRKLAERLLQDETDDNRRIDRLFLKLACRVATDVERQVCEKLLGAMRQRFGDEPDAARQLLSTGESPTNEKLSIVEVAAWSQVVTAVMASDAAIVVY